MNLFEVVKASINTQEAAQAYGIDVNHYGMALCPFHNDRHPSLYVSDDHYHCFACGEHGDVIDLTAKLFDLRLYDAARKLASDFHLAPDKPLPELIRRKMKHKTKAQQLRENERLCFSVCAPGGARFLRVRVPNPPGSGKDIAEGKGVHREVESEGSRMWGTY